LRPPSGIRFCGDLAAGGVWVGWDPGQLRAQKQKTDNRYDVIAVWKIDRSGRSLKRLANALADLDSLGVAFVSLRNNLDLNTPSGRLMFQVIGAMSKFERSLIQERVRAGLRNAVARGVRLGRPKQNEDAGEIARLRASGASWREVSEQMGIGVGTAVRALRQSLQKPHGIAPPNPLQVTDFGGSGI
jgi:DNA invertase Pin-like site-specific DNA recombinase